MLTLTDTQQVPCSLGYQDADGNPVSPPPGARFYRWTVDVDDIVALTPQTFSPQDDGSRCLITALGKVPPGTLGTCTVTVRVTDMQGHSLATGTLDVTVVGQGGVVAVINAGPISEQ